MAIIEDGVPWYEYACSYKDPETGGQFCISFYAKSMSDAHRRLAIMKGSDKWALDIDGVKLCEDFKKEDPIPFF